MTIRVTIQVTVRKVAISATVNDASKQAASRFYCLILTKLQLKCIAKDSIAHHPAIFHNFGHTGVDTPVSITRPASA